MVRHTVPEEHTWLFETSYVARNRLRRAAITNRQAAIRGIPYIEEEEATQIMKVLLALRGSIKRNKLKRGKLALWP